MYNNRLNAEREKSALFPALVSRSVKEEDVMKKMVVLCLFLVCTLSVNAAEQSIALPKVEAKAGMDIVQAIETRTASRQYDGREVPLQAISTILWAGYGIILEEGEKTVHGYDAVSAATSRNRYSVPFGWGSPYLKVYLLLQNGAYAYVPEEHNLKFMTDKNLIKDSGSGDSNAYGVIVIAADFDKMPGGNNGSTRDVAFMTAGSVAQNMYIAGAVYNIQMLTQVSIKHKNIKNGLNLPKDVEPLTILSFGYSK